MTKEEVINGLKDNLCSLCAYGSQNMDSCDIRECDNRDYIKALEQQLCGDCVSRQAVIDTIIADSKRIGINHRYTSSDNMQNELDDIKSLPPVTPTLCIADVRFSKEDLREICKERIEIACEHETCKKCSHNDSKNRVCRRGHRFALRDPETFYCADYS